MSPAPLNVDETERVQGPLTLSETCTSPRASNWLNQPSSRSPAATGSVRVSMSDSTRSATSTADRVESDMLTLTEPVAAGDLLLGWFSQFDALGEVQVSDNVNGPWTRSVSSTFSGAGDIALYYRENSAAAPSGLVITVSASAPAYLQAAAADYRDVATAGALDQAVLSDGQGTYASTGPTASVPAGELVVAAVITGGQPASAIPGSSQRVPYVLDVRNG